MQHNVEICGKFQTHMHPDVSFWIDATALLWEKTVRAVGFSLLLSDFFPEVCLSGKQIAYCSVGIEPHNLFFKV